MKEMQESLLSLRFVVGLLFVLIIYFASGLIFCRTFKDSLDEYHRGLQLYESALESSRTGLNELFHEIIPLAKEPRLTSIFASGNESRYPSSISISAVWPMGGFFAGMNPNVRQGNYKLEKYTDFDWAFVVGVILSFLSIVLSFDAVSRDREAGTLKLQLSNSPKRAQILMSKYLAIVLLLCVPTTIGLVLNVVTVQLLLAQNIVLSFPLHTAAVFLLSLLYLSMFVWLGLLTSGWVSRSSMGLALLLLFWTFFVILAPYVGGMVAGQVHPVVSRETHEKQFRAILEQCLQKAPKEYGEFYTGRESEEGWKTIDKWFNETDLTIERLSLNRFNELLSQAMVAQRISSLMSPFASFRYALESISNTGLQYHQMFYSNVQRYRHEIRDFIRQQDLLDPQSKHRLYYVQRIASVSAKPIDPSLIPQFTMPLPDPLQSLQNIGFSFSYLLALNVVFFLLARFAFSRADVR